MNEIDIVIPWVNPEDDIWFNEYKEACKQFDGDKTPQRIRDFGTIIYLLRGIEKNMPWVRYIHLLLYSNTQIPLWLNIKHPKLKIHYHNEICKPSFNNLYFTTYIYKLSELSEYFIYLNDDIIPLNLMQKEDWFIDGKAVDTIQKSKMINSNPIHEQILEKNHIIYEMQNDENLDFFQKIVRNSLYLSKYYTGKFNIWKNVHIGTSCIKSEYCKIMEDLKNELNVIFLNYHFRTDKQIVPHWFYRYVRLNCNNFANRLDNTKFVYKEIHNEKVNFILDEYNNGVKMLCINDILDNEKNFNKTKNNTISVFQKIFPDKSEFEL